MKYKIKTHTLELNEPHDSIMTSADLYDVLKKQFGPFSPFQESMYVIGLSGHNTVIYEEVFRGTVNSAVVSPKDIFRTLILNGCASFAIAHNHPSGEINPSCEDQMVTNKFWRASELMDITMIDHLIVSNKDYFSFNQARRMK